MTEHDIINLLEDYKLQQSKSKNKELSKSGMWIVVKTIDDCIQLIKKRVTNEEENTTADS